MKMSLLVKLDQGPSFERLIDNWFSQTFSLTKCKTNTLMHIMYLNQTKDDGLKAYLRNNNNNSKKHKTDTLSGIHATATVEFVFWCLTFVHFVY